MVDILTYQADGISVRI